jgi:hypothetical protein
MKGIHVTHARDGWWIYTVWIYGRPVVVGRARTRERAEHEAHIA